MIGGDFAVIGESLLNLHALLGDPQGLLMLAVAR